MRWTPEAFRDAFDVSRETTARLEAYAALLAQWTARINLVSDGTLPDIWGRHFADSAQLWTLRPTDARTWLDLGSGAGFPGLVIAAMAAERAPELRVALVEGDQRKAAFLRRAAAVVGVAVDVHAIRVEALPPAGADVVSARALAPLEALLAHAEKHRRPGGICLFPKGAAVHKEIEATERKWRFDHRLHPSLTDSRAAIMEIGAMGRV